MPDQNMLYLLAVALFATGLFSGLLAGLLGVGGGIVVVPVMFHIFTQIGLPEEVRIHLAVGTSLATIIPTSIMSLRSHAKRGSVDFDLLRSWAPAVFVGTLVGTALAAPAKGQVLTMVFATVALAVALQMAFLPLETRVADHLPTSPAKHLMPMIIGAISAMMGIGGGTLSVPTLSLFNYPIRRAVGTSSAIGLVIAIPGTIGFILAGWNVEGRPPWSLGYVSLIGFALIVPASLLTAPYGAKLAHSISVKALRRAFAVFLGITSLRMFYGLLT